MIYVIIDCDPFTETSCIVATINTDIDIEGEYKKFIHKEAENRNIIINEHRYNMMNRENYHINLTDLQYKNKNKKWIKFLKKNTLLTFVKNKLNLVIKEFITNFALYLKLTMREVILFILSLPIILFLRSVYEIGANRKQNLSTRY